MTEISTIDDANLLGLRCKFLICAAAHAPLVVLVHGRAGNYDVMWTFRRCIPEGVNIVAVQAPLPDKLGGYSWWDVSEKQEVADLIKVPSVTLLPFISNFMQKYSLKPSKLSALGFSQGAGLLSLCMQLEPARFKAVAFLAGFVVELDQSVRAESLPEVFIAHGIQDQAVPIGKAKRAEEFLRQRGHPVTYVQDSVGHKVGTQGMRALKDWLASALL